jgi:hypothetical protein
MVGGFARWVGVYDGAIQSGHYVLVEKIGEYELWKRLDTGE